MLALWSKCTMSSSTGLVPPSSTTNSLESAAAASANTASAEQSSSTNEVVALRQPRRPRGFFTRGDSALERFSAAVAKAAASVSDSFPRSTPSASNDPQVRIIWYCWNGCSLFFFSIHSFCLHFQSENKEKSFSKKMLTYNFQNTLSRLIFFKNG